MQTDSLAIFPPLDEPENMHQQYDCQTGKIEGKRKTKDQKEKITQHFPKIFYFIHLSSNQDKIFHHLFPVF